MRIGELCGLELDCIRTDGEGNHFLKVPLGKMNNERLVPLDKPTLALVNELQAEGRPGRTWLLETKRGRRTRREHYRAPLEEAAKGIEIPDGLTSHRLRHTYATTLLNAGMGLMGIMKLLGHRDYRRSD